MAGKSFLYQALPEPGGSAGSGSLSSNKAPGGISVTESLRRLPGRREGCTETRKLRSASERRPRSIDPGAALGETGEDWEGRESPGFLG